MNNKKPNIIFIYADDLGMGMLGCYGQKQIHTPNIDRIATEGMKFERAYGTAFCAPARASVICGIHDAHAGRWTFTKGGLYYQVGLEGDNLHNVMQVIQQTGISQRKNDVFLGTVAKKAGYVTGEIGKLEWGFATTPQEMELHGWDYHFGYYDHQMCHGFYPPFLFENGDFIRIEGNNFIDCGKASYDPEILTEEFVYNMEGKKVYSQDLFDDKILEFIHQHKDENFFLFHPSQLPHGPTMFPDIYPEIACNPNLNRIEKEYASMVIRLDKTVGKILDELEKLSILDNTIIIFSSDNGHEPAYYTRRDHHSSRETIDGRKINAMDIPYRTEECGDIFNGNCNLAGTKCTNWEGGVRVPLIIKWPGMVKEGTVTNHLVSNYDLLGTIADLLDVELPESKDSLSYLPVIEGQTQCPEHDYVIYSSFYGPGIVTKDGWKLRIVLHIDRALNYSGFGASLDNFNANCGVVYQLFKLSDDYQERNNVAAQYPDKVKELIGILLKECDGNLIHGTPNAHFAFSNA